LPFQTLAVTTCWHHAKYFWKGAFAGILTVSPGPSIIQIYVEGIAV